MVPGISENVDKDTTAYLMRPLLTSCIWRGIRPVKAEFTSPLLPPHLCDRGVTLTLIRDKGQDLHVGLPSHAQVSKLRLTADA